MSTTKPRINITTEPEIAVALKSAAKRDGIPVATKASELLTIGLAMEEDLVLSALAEQRLSSAGEFVNHDNAWS